MAVLGFGPKFVLFPSLCMLIRFLQRKEPRTCVYTCSHLYTMAYPSCHTEVPITLHFPWSVPLSSANLTSVIHSHDLPYGLHNQCNKWDLWSEPDKLNSRVPKVCGMRLLATLKPLRNRLRAHGQLTWLEWITRAVVNRWQGQRWQQGLSPGKGGRNLWLGPGPGFTPKKLYDIGSCFTSSGLLSSCKLMISKNCQVLSMILFSFILNTGNCQCTYSGLIEVQQTPFCH